MSPTVRFTSATDTDAMSNLKFATIPLGGALLNLWISGATALDAFGISIGDRDLIVQGTLCNIEISADVIDVDRDQMLFDEVLTGGQLFFPVTVTTALQALLSLRYL